MLRKTISPLQDSQPFPRRFPRSLTNFSFFYPTLIEGAVHDRSGTAAMLLTDTLLGATGFAILIIALRVLGAPEARAFVPRDLTNR